MLWDVADDPRGALRWSLSKLRGLVDAPNEPRIVADREHARLEGGNVEVDFWLAASAAREPDTLSLERLETIASSFRGELLEGLDLEEFEEYRAWSTALRDEALRAHRALLRAWRTRAETPEHALVPARRLVLLDPSDETLRAELVTLLGRAGNLDEARKQVAIAKRVLGAVAPTGPLRSAEAALGREAPAPAPVEVLPPRPPPPIAFVPSMRSAVHGLRLVGREAELADLGQLLDRTKASGRVRVVLVTGEPGIGKSRLLAEAPFEARRRGGFALEGTAYEPERASPFAAWRDLARRAPVASLGGDAAKHAQAVRDPDASPGALRDAMVALLRPTKGLGLVVLDDAHWLDEASAELLHHVCREHDRSPLLVLLGARDVELADNLPLVRTLRALRRARAVEERALGALDREGISRLVNLVAPQSDAERAFQESGGNPLFALELARNEGSNHPGTLGLLVRERLERLNAEALDVLRWAAVLGSTFRVRPLAEVTGGTANVLPALELLERHALLGAVLDFADPGGTYQFGHEVVQRTVYGELSEPRRRLMHREVALVLSRLHAADPSKAAEIAHHAIRAHEPTLAYEACANAARHCAKLDAMGQAHGFLRQARAQLDGLMEPLRGEAAVRLDALEAELGREAS
ncbi:MAG: AAA family ATPase [Sandaracinus sp.]|nr:AAA family ATPase [Sandaracinus sp.]